MKLYRLAALGAAVSLLFTGCAMFPEEEETLAPPLKAPAAVTYTTTTVSRGTIVESSVTTGSFISTLSYDLSFGNRSGYLSQVLVKAGDTVTKGQLLATLESEDLEFAVTQQKYAVEKAQIALRAAQNAPGATSDSIRLAQIDLELAQLQLDKYTEELDRLSIYAPCDGTVSYLKSTVVGEYIAARSTVVRIVDPASLQVECKGDTVQDFALGKEVNVTYAKTSYTGTVVMTLADAPADLKEIGEPFIRVALSENPEGDGLSLIGKSVTVELIKQKKEDVIVVPRNVVSTYSGDSYVLVLENGVKKERPIELGIKGSTEVEIVSGLEEGEEIIIK